MAMKRNNIGVISSEENQRNVDIFTNGKCAKLHFSPTGEKQFKKKKTEYDLKVWKSFSRSTSENREIEDIPTDELNILIYRFMMDIKKKDGVAYKPTTLDSFQRS